MFFNSKPSPCTVPDPLTAAQNGVDKLAAALTGADAELAFARRDYDLALHSFIASDYKVAEPSQEPQRTATVKVDSLRRLLSQAREDVARLSHQRDDAHRIDAIRASGGRVASLVATAESKVAAFEEAVAAARKAETELLDALFDQSSGLRQPFKAAEIQRDADFARHRLRHQLITIAAQGHCLIDARFEVDGEVHLGPLEDAFYQGR